MTRRRGRRQLRSDHGRGQLRLGGSARRLRSVVITLGTLVLLTQSPSAAAETPDDHRLEWEYRRFSIVEYGALANVAGQLAFLEFRAKATAPGWQGGILFDDEAREVLRLDTREAKATVGRISDPITLGLQIVPLAVDSVVIPLALDQFNLDVAWQMLMVDAQALSAIGFFTRFGHNVVRRARPSAEDCERDKDFDELCGSGEFASFPSGHTSGAFAGAGLSCAHHQNLPLYGGGAPDVIFGCALPMTLATTNGALRLLADRHYISDVIVGAAAGFAAGFGLPTVLHYAHASAGSQKDAPLGAVSVQPAIGEDEVVLFVGGTF